MNSAAALSTAVDARCCSLATRRALMASRARRLMWPVSTTLVRNRIASVTTAADSSDSACSQRSTRQRTQITAQAGRCPVQVGCQAANSTRYTATPLRMPFRRRGRRAQCLRDAARCS